MLLLAACGSSDPEIPLPGAWKAERSESTIELSDEGTGRVVDLRVWSGVRECRASTAESYSGPVTWSRIDRGSLVLTTNTEAEVLVLADGGFFSTDWGTLDVAMCGEGSTEDEVVVYARTGGG